MRILLPTDGSELALDAVHHALRLVREGLQASFVLANVQEPPHLYEVWMTRDAQARETAMREAGEHALQPAEALLQQAGVDYESEVAIGNPVHLLTDIAERYGCDAIVMGMRGKGLLRSTLPGSVAQAVLNDSTIPVTVVKHEDVEAVLDDAAADDAEE